MEKTLAVRIIVAPTVCIDRQINDTWPNLNDIYSQLLLHLTTLVQFLSIGFPSAKVICKSTLYFSSFRSVVPQ